MKYILLSIIPITIFLIGSTILTFLNKVLHIHIPTIGVLLLVGLIIATPIYLVLISFKQLSNKVFSFIVITIYLFISMFIFICFVHIIGLIWGNQDTLSKALNKLAIQFELLLLCVSWIIACIVKSIQIMLSKER